MRTPTNLATSTRIRLNPWSLPLCGLGNSPCEAGSDLGEDKAEGRTKTTRRGEVEDQDEGIRNLIDYSTNRVFLTVLVGYTSIGRFHSRTQSPRTAEL